LFRFFYGKKPIVITRNSVNYRVDLAEGVDFAIFLTGGFQQHVIDFSLMQLVDGKGDILDIGANVGHMTLLYAKKYSNSLVHAFEPTDYAFSKLSMNVSLNQSLAPRIILNKAIVGDMASSAEFHKGIYSSWKLVSSGSRDERHSVHGGTRNSVTDAGFVRIDDYVNLKGISSVAIIKIDTDGSELEVLKGAFNVLLQKRPVVVFEVGLYLLAERDISFMSYLEFFDALKYSIVLADNLRRSIDRNNFRHMIPENGTVDLVAIPQTKD
jgi:FkbM family methyltransferase